MLKDEHKVLMQMLGNVVLEANNDIDYMKVDGALVLNLAVGHNVETICSQELLKCELEEKNKNYIVSKSHEAIFKNIKYINTQNSLIDEFIKSDIKYTILKGVGVSCNYQNPMLRVSSDLDIYVKPSEFEDAKEKLIEVGYEYEKTNTDYHSAFIKDNFEVELHNALPGLPRGSIRNEFVKMKDLTSRAINLRSGNMEVYIPCIEDNATVQLLHILHHTLEKGMNIRLLCDWLAFVKKNLNDDVWKNMEKDFTQVGLDRMAKVLTRIGEIYFGLDDNNITWHRSVMEQDCENYISFIFEERERELNRTDHKEINYETSLSEEVWESKRSIWSIIIRNVKLLLTGKRNIKRIFQLKQKLNYKTKKIVNLNLMTKKYAKYYAF